MVHMSLRSTDRETFATVLFVPCKKCHKLYSILFWNLFWQFYYICPKTHNIFGNNYLFLLALVHVSMSICHPHGVSCYICWS